MRHHAFTRCNLIGANVGHDDGTVYSDTQLCAVGVTDAYPFSEAEGGLEPRHGRSHIRIDQYRSHGGGWCGAIRQHAG